MQITLGFRFRRFLGQQKAQVPSDPTTCRNNCIELSAWQLEPLKFVEYPQSQ